MPPKSSLYLIDGSSQMYRAYHAIRTLTGPDGKSTNAVYGFVTMLRKLINEHHPELLAVAFDVAGPTFRSELAADYKATRAPMPTDLAEQVPWIHEACDALGVPVLTAERYEADDVIGTIAEQAVAAGHTVAIVTGDKDFFQLVRDTISVFNPRDEGTWYDADGVTAKFGVAPDQVVDVLALMGDAIDNVKGVPGIGEKGARDLISTYGSLDRVLASADRLPQKKYREALLAHADTARQSRTLVQIHTEVPLTFDPEALRYRGAVRERCFDLFWRLGFRSLLPEWAPTADTVDQDYQPVETRAELDQLVAELRAAGRFALHVISDVSVAMRATIVGLSFATAAGRARYLPLAHRSLDAGVSLDPAQALERLKPVLEDPAILKVSHDFKFAMQVLARHGISLQGLDGDTMLASYLLDATRSAHLLEDLALEHVRYKAITTEQVVGRGSRARTFGDLPVSAVVDYAGERSDLALQLADRFGPALKHAALEDLYRQLELPLIPVLVDIERTGVRIDTAVLAAQSQRIERDLSNRTAQIFTLAGEEFNINSPKQLSEVLFDRLKLPAQKRTGKTRAASTASEVLEELSLVHELPRQILDWRALQKLKSTYLDALPRLVDPQTGRVHTSFNQAVAATGRLSSSDPNLQNVPIRTELGREIRRAFTAEPGCLLISADYSQIELRVLAHLSADAALIAAFKRGDDIHDQTAHKVFGSESGLDAHERRRRAKIVNYALLYGKTAFTLAQDIGVTPQAAQEFIEAYFDGFPGVRRFIDETIARARETGVVTTMFGRRRRVPELTSRNGQIRAAAERVTVNLPIQGTAADILKRAMIDLHRTLAHRAPMILTVHDELLFEVPGSEAVEVAALVRERMEQAVPLVVPLTVDIGIGENWKEAKA